MGMTKGFKGVLVLAGLASLIGGGYYVLNHSAKKTTASKEVVSGQLGTQAESTVDKTTDKHLPLPQFNKPTNKGRRIDIYTMFWNAGMGLAYAVGGNQTSVGSIFAKYNIDAHIIWQDDCNKTMDAFKANAEDIKKNPEAVPVISLWMGDGEPGFTVSASSLLKLGKDYKLMGFDHLGRSAGEDCYWAPKEWKDDPSACLGHCVAFVKGDGDGNIVLKWAGDNHGRDGKKIKINVDQAVFDSDALNIMNADDYVKAGEKYVSGYTETRMLKKNGVVYPNIKIVCTCDAYSSWTPVDVNVCEKKGGLVRIASTADYTGQMPDVASVLQHWAYSSKDHQDLLVDFCLAVGEGGDQVRSFTDALGFASKVSAHWFGDQKDFSPERIAELYQGTFMKDKTGMRVAVGGSKAWNLADAANNCGLGQDGIDRYKQTYEYFSSVLQDLYPADMKGVSSYKDFFDPNFIRQALDKSKGNDTISTVTEESQKPVVTGEITNEVSSKLYNLNFDLGKATIKPEFKQALNDMFRSKVISGGLRMGVYGHTDNIGSDRDNGQANLLLSKARAAAVADYLVNVLHVKRTDLVIEGFGDKNPISGTTKSDALNRCVEIVQGK